MKAVRYYGPKDLRIESDVQIPQYEHGRIPDGNVLIQIEFCGLCGSDIHSYLHESSNIPIKKGNHYCSTVGPAIIGHEFSGIVEQIGNGVTKLQKGDRVAVLATLYCSQCANCKAGLDFLCLKRGFYGYSGLAGGFAQKAIVQETHAFKLPESISGEVGALVEPLAVGWHAVKQANFKKGQTALIIGSGPIGLAVLLALKSSFFAASKVFVSEPGLLRRQQAVQFGADNSFDPTKDDIVKEVLDATGGFGADVVFECSGIQKTLETACATVRARGYVCVIALFQEPVMVDFFKMLLTEKNICFSATYTKEDYVEVIEAIASGSMKPEAMITSKISLDQVVTHGFEELLTNRDGHVKILVHP